MSLFFDKKILILRNLDFIYKCRLCMIIVGDGLYNLDKVINLDLFDNYIFFMYYIYIEI